MQYSLSILALLYLLIVIKHYEGRKERLWRKEKEKKKKKEKKKRKKKKAIHCCGGNDDNDADGGILNPKQIRAAYDRRSSFSSKEEDEVFSPDPEAAYQNGQPVRGLSVQFSNLKETEDGTGQDQVQETEEDEDEDEEDEEVEDGERVIEQNLALVGQVSQMSEGINLYLRLGAVGKNFSFPLQPWDWSLASKEVPRNALHF